LAVENEGKLGFGNVGRLNVAQPDNASASVAAIIDRRAE
jgi:hypothetical protein